MSAAPPRRLAAAAVALAATVAPALAGEAAFVLQPLADGVALARPVEPGPGRTNALVVERVDGLVVAGAQPTPAAAREFLEVVAGGDPGRVRYLVLSHGHAEAAGGASAFPASTTVIASEPAERILLDPLRDIDAELSILGLSGGDEIPRRRPSLVIDSKAILGATDPIVVVTRIGNGHSPGDLAVAIPDLGVVWVGGLLAGERRVAYWGDGRMGPWMSAVNRLLNDGYTTFCGLRVGAVDAAAVRRERDAIAWVRGTVESLILDGVKVDDLADAVRASPELAGNFDPGEPFLGSLITMVVDEAVEARAKRGIVLE